MRTRFVSAMVGLCILFAVLAFYQTIVVNIALCIIILIAVDELLEVSGIIRNVPLSVTSFLFGGIIPFYQFFYLDRYFPVLLFVVTIAMLLILLKEHHRTSIEQLTFTFMMTAMVAISLSLFIVMRDRLGITVGIFGAGLTFIAAWMTDTGAYFTGVFFGKHKLAPLLSPKKTIEGFIGGTVIGVLSILGGAWIFSQVVCPYFGWQVIVNYKLLAFVAPFLSMTGVIGDLSASAIKRQFGIKDFGKIMPGHGGVLDRFDSVLLISPLTYFIVVYLQPIIVL